MKYVIINKDGLTELREDSKEILPAGGLVLSDVEFTGVQNGTLLFINNMLIPA
jgi:hypothetical protein